MKWPYYLGIYLFGAGLLLSTTLASSQLVGSDIHLEYYFAKQTLENGYNVSLPNSVNSALSVSLFAPYISKGSSIPLIYVFKVVYPLLYALVPVLLLFIYSKFMPFKWAFLSSLFFVITPTFFLEMPQIAREEFTQLILVALLAGFLLTKELKYSALWLLLGSLLVVVSHYSSATLWIVLLSALVIGFLVTKEYQNAFFAFDILAVTIGIFIFYTHWSSSSWQVEDIGNTVKSVTSTIAGGDGSLTEVVRNTALTHIGATQYMLRMALGLDFFNVDLPSKLFRVIQILTEIGLVTGIVVMLRTKTVPKVYKVLIACTALMLMLAIIFPVIASTINPTRFYHLMLLIVAPGLVFGICWLFKSRGFVIASALLAVYFIFTSGLVFKLAGYQDISQPTVPYSIVMDNQTLDAGNYLTSDDSKVAEWAFDNGIKVIYGDVGGTLIAQDYYDNYHSLPWNYDQPLESGSYLLVRTWNTEHGYSAWVGPGLKKQLPLRLPEGKILYQSGQAYVMEVQ